VKGEEESIMDVMEGEEGGIRLSKQIVNGEVDYKIKSGTVWNHSCFLRESLVSPPAFSFLTLTTSFSAE